VCNQRKEVSHLLNFLLVSRMNQERNIECNQSSSVNKHIAPQGFFLLGFGGAKQEIFFIFYFFYFFVFYIILYGIISIV
jgi:hypothetical protein